MNGARDASIHARLLNLARKRGDDFNRILIRYALERFLYRLSMLPEAREGMLLKGAMLFDLWFGTHQRPTRDADFLGFGPMDGAALVATVRSICAVKAEDGMVFDPGSVAVEDIREEARYGGLRIRLNGLLGNARCAIQLDVGYGDAVTPGAEEAIYPTLLDDMPAPNLRVYPRATVVAEKLEAIARLGMANSRMKDYYDLGVLAREGALDPRQLAQAIAATFARRGTPLPPSLPLGLTDEYSNDPAKLRQWRAFIEKNRLVAPSLAETVEEVAEFLLNPLHLARDGIWQP